MTTKGDPETVRTISLRITGLALIAAVLFTLDPDHSNRALVLALNVTLIVGALLALQNVLAVALATFALAATNAEPNSQDWLLATAYPMLAVAAGACVLVILVRRFQKRVIETRQSRWKDR